MDKNTLMAFNLLYGGSLYGVIYCDENFNVIKANKYAKSNYQPILKENQLVKYFSSPNRHLAVIKLRECDTFDAIIKSPDNNRYKAHVSKIDGYNKGCIVTLYEYEENSKEFIHKNTVDKEILDIIISKFKKSINENNNLLNYITPILENKLLKKEKDIISLISSNLYSMLATVLNIEIFQKIKNGELQNDIKRIHVNHFLNHLFQDISTRFQNAGVKFEYSITMTDIVTCIDPRLLNQMILNPVVNAFQFHTKGTTIKARLTEKDGYFNITVQNIGELLGKKHTNQIFNPFYSYDPRNNEPQGAGLGLTISRNLAELYNGSCKFSSTKKYGNVCVIRLPISDNKNLTNVTFNERDILSCRSDMEKLLDIYLSGLSQIKSIDDIL